MRVGVVSNCDGYVTTAQDPQEYSIMTTLVSLRNDPSIYDKEVMAGLRDLQSVCYGNALAAGWYQDMNTGGKKVINFGERIALIHSEITEAYAAVEMNEKDDKLPHRQGYDVEMADVLIRVFDQAGYEGYDLATTMKDQQRDRGAVPPITMIDKFAVAMLDMHRQCSIALEADRKGLALDKAYALAGLVRIILSDVSTMDADIAGSVIEKLRFNKERADHKMENRQSQGGKSY